MALLGLDRFATWLRNATLVKGPYAPELLESVQPVLDVGRLAAEFDDRIAYWHTKFQQVAALAANFSTVTIRCGSGRAVVDGLALSGGSGQAVVNLGAGGASLTPVAAWQGNAYSKRTGLASPISLAVIETDIEQTVGGRLAGAGTLLPVYGTGAVFSYVAGTLPAFVLSPAAGGGSASNLVVETQAVNAQLGVAAWGRWFPETLPA